MRPAVPVDRFRASGIRPRRWNRRWRSWGQIPRALIGLERLPKFRAWALTPADPGTKPGPRPFVLIMPHPPAPPAMRLFLLKRLLTLIATLVVASVAIFWALEVLPGNAAEVLRGPAAAPEAVQVPPDGLEVTE